MEFLRFGSSIPGSYWGCCACCIIQNFKVSPTAPASIELMSGDGGQPLIHTKGGSMFAGTTYGDIFRQRLRYGTFHSGDMPNHMFLAILTDWQIRNGVGAEWLKILKEEGFEFLRTTDNSVYSGPSLASADKMDGDSAHKNYLFALCRNVGNGNVVNPLQPPAEWTKLDKVVPEIWDILGSDDKERAERTKAFALEQKVVHRKLYDKLPKGVFYTRKELEEKGVPVTLGGRRSDQPQQLASVREKNNPVVAKAAPFKGKAEVVG